MGKPARSGVATIVLGSLLWELAGLCYGQAANEPGEASARQMAPIDLTGYWVSVVSQDWRWRMVRPARGDYASVPITELSYATALKWDPAKDEAAGLQCRAFGAAGLMQLPERLHILWKDDDTLVMQTDTGMQTRVFHFGSWRAPAGDAPSWQGESTARWEIAGGPQPAAIPGPQGFEALARRPPAAAGEARSAPARYGSLRVQTTHLLSGYLRTNGLPYSDQTRLVEYWDLQYQDKDSGTQRPGTPWIILTSVVHDPVYLQSDWITALNFKQEPDGARWDPRPCTSRW